MKKHDKFTFNPVIDLRRRAAERSAGLAAEAAAMNAALKARQDRGEETRLKRSDLGHLYNRAIERVWYTSDSMGIAAVGGGSFEVANDGRWDALMEELQIPRDPRCDPDAV